MQTKRKQRGRTIPAPQWWMDAAEERKEHLGLKQHEIAASVARHLNLPAGSEIDQSRISRCMSGDSSPIVLLDAISAVLAIPSPVYIAASINEAREFKAVHVAYAERLASASPQEAERERILSELDLQASAIEAGVPSIANKRRPAVLQRSDESRGKAGSRPHGTAAGGSQPGGMGGRRKRPSAS